MIFKVASLHAEFVFQVLPIENGPCRSINEFCRFGNRLRAKFAHKAHEARDLRGEAREVTFIAVVPAEVQVTVGAIECGQVRQHSAVSDHWSCDIGLLK